MTSAHVFGRMLKMTRWTALLFAGIWVVGAIVGLVVGAEGDAGTRWIEASLLAVAGAFIARSLVALLLYWAEPAAAATAAGATSAPDAGLASRGACKVILTGFFFLFMGLETVVWFLVNGVARLFGASGVAPELRLFSRPGALLWLATLVGAVTGAADGAFRIHRYSGVFPFPLDVTAGLSGATNGSLMHLGNLVWGRHRQDSTPGITPPAPVPRKDAHQYEVGFYIEPTAAFTQGSVMSNMAGTSAGLYDHELSHVWQNRIAGPLFTLTYVFWMEIMIVPGAIAQLVTGDARSIRTIAYANCPWEVMGYEFGGGRGGNRTYAGSPVAPGPRDLLWTGSAALVASIPLLVFMALFAWHVIRRVWVAKDAGFSWWDVAWPMRGCLLYANALGNYAVGFALLAWSDSYWAIGAYGLVAGCLTCLALIGPVGRNRAYQGLLAWCSPLLPMCWPAHACGLALFILAWLGNAVAAAAWLLRRLGVDHGRGLRHADYFPLGADYPARRPPPPSPTIAACGIHSFTGQARVANLVMVGGWPIALSRALHGWLGTPRDAIQLGSFTFVHPAHAYPSGEVPRATLEYSSGLLLTTAAFGSMVLTAFCEHFRVWIDEATARPRAFWRRIAESHVARDSRSRAPYGHEATPRDRLPMWG